MDLTRAFACVLLVLLLVPEKNAWPQFSYSIHYTVNDGLPSSKVYDIIQDSSGYIWFATENGVSRYNGYEFENFTTSEGLPTNSTIKLYEDYKGRIWFLSYQGTLSYFENDHIHGLAINDLLPEFNAPFIANLYVDTTDALWLSPFNGGLYRYIEGEAIETIHESPEVRRRVYFYLSLESNGHILASIKPKIEFADSRDEIIATANNEYYIRFDIDRSEHHYGFVNIADYFLISLGRKIVQIENQNVTYKRLFEKEIVSLNGDRYNNLWVSEKFNGVYQYPGRINEEPVNHFLPDHTVSKVLLDTEGNYWFATTESGVYFVPSLSIRNYTSELEGLKNDNILSFDIFNDKIFFSTDGKEIYQAHIQENSLNELQCLNMADKLVNNVYSVLAISENTFYATADPSVELYNIVEVVQIDKLQMLSVDYGYDLVFLNNGDLVLAHANGFRMIRGTQIIYDSPEYFHVRVFVSEQAPDSSFWLGSIDGLYGFKDSIISNLYPDNPVLSSRISALKYHKECLWVGSFDNGLVIISPDSTYYLNENNGLSSNRIKSIFSENDSVYWVGTNRGLNRVIVRGVFPKQFFIEVLNLWDGLPSNEINSIDKHNEDIWLGTDNGLVSFDPVNIEFRHKPGKLYIRKIEVENLGEIEIENQAKLAYDQNDIFISYNAISYKDPTSTSYFYKLEGLNQSWNETRNTSVRFHGLPPGEYTFRIQASNMSGAISQETTYRFIIQKHFSQTNLFRIFILLVGATFIFLVIRYFLNNQRKKIELQRKIYLAEQKAMLSQMNPHFIFNSLNSIQNFILDNDSENANTYLVTFSSLIRKVLDVSQKNFISLTEELETIKLYLELEKFRFNEKFDYNIEVNSGIRTDSLMIPSLILQPYLENAIWHGIIPKNDHGLLQVIVADSKEEGLIISISDDGIGRTKAAEINQRRKHHTPTGMKNVEERLNLLNALNKTHMRARITDLYHDSGEARGTMVELFLDGISDK